MAGQSQPSPAGSALEYHQPPYSKVTKNAQLCFGVFLDGRCGGCAQFGPSLDKSKIVHLVRNTPFNGFLELNRFCLADWLPRNSESRSLSIMLRLIRRHYPHVQWIISFADGTQCGHGTIYQATGFVLGGEVLQGFQYRYLYPLHNDVLDRLTVDIIPYSRIREIGGEMRKGERFSRSEDLS